MSNEIEFDPVSFAASYIQTLPYSKQQSDFKNEKDYLEYLKARRDNYFREYLRSALYANKNFRNLNLRDPLMTKARHLI